MGVVDGLRQAREAYERRDWLAAYDVLNDVAEMAYTHTDKDILRLYEIWLKTGSPRAYSILRRLGVAPVSAPTPADGRQEH